MNPIKDIIEKWKLKYPFKPVNPNQWGRPTARPNCVGYREGVQLTQDKKPQST